MKKFFLIPLLTLLCTVMAWGTTVQVASDAELKAAISNADADVIQLIADINDATTYTFQRSLTLDLNGHRIFQPSANASQRIFLLYKNGIDVTIENGVIERESDSYIYQGKTDKGLGVWVYQANSLTLNNVTVNKGYFPFQIYAGTTTLNNVTTATTATNGEIYVSGGNLIVNDGCNISADYGYGIESKGTVTINGGNISAKYGIYVFKNTSRLYVNGGTITGNSFAISGNGSSGNEGTTINITGGNIHGGAAAIYHPQAGTLNITDGTFTSDRESTIEMRAGTLTIDGGSFTANASEFVNEANGSGSTTTGAAIAIAQHTTKLPIEVVINGGDFRAIYPIAQANPQKNETAYVDQVNITVNGGKFWATNTANVAAYSQDNKLSLKGGYFNLAPHAFVADGYMAISNPDAAPAPTAAEGYLFKVGEYVEDPTSVLTNGNWVVETTWESTEVPTEVSAVTIPANGEVFIQPTGADEVVAYASSLDLEAGATLTIKDGATLVLGKDADVDANANLVVEEGGQLLIAPTATPVQPVGSVTLVADGAGLKEGKSDHTDPANLYWQHFAIPTVGAPTSIALSYPNRTPITEPITYYNTWDIVNGWESIVKGDLTEPFVGYNFSNIKDYGTNVNYTFTGQLVGNASSPMNFTRRGFNFFGNSYLAPINIQALQSSMYEQGLEFTVYIFTKQGKRQTYRAINEVTASIYGIDEIKPLQGFFMFAEKATEADFQYNSAVYSAFINKQNGGAANNAPTRRAASQYDAKAIIGIESAEGSYDEVVLVQSDNFSDEYDLKADARKMENAGMNIYADGSFDYLAVMATNDLMGQTLSFKAGNEAQYTMTFSGIEGELAIRDNATGAIIAMEEGASYEFAAQPNSTVEGRFEILPIAKMPTAIENTEVKANAKGIYTLTGQYVGEDFKALPAGVYVVNGVKIVK